MAGKRLSDRRIVVNYNGELLQAQARKKIMKYFIEEHELCQERYQMAGEELHERRNGADAHNGGELYWHICEDQQG